MNRKIFSIFLFLLIVFIGYYKKDLFVDWIHEGGALAVWIGMLLTAIDVFFPVIPFPLLAGIVGAVFGALQGTGITLAGSMIGTLLMFLMARYGFKDWAQQKLKSYPKAKEYETYFEKNAFVSILLARLIPVLPSPVVNVLCGISNVRWSIFLLASFLGKGPSFFIYAFAGSQFEKSKWLSIGIYVAYALIAGIFANLYMRKKQA
ncbi:MAG TPA: TVP38/TMEM64 family protein [Bacillota bacterium]|nr:TVP38/TMEM64 family protein [Bacillota bacterium]